MTNNIIIYKVLNQTLIMILLTDKEIETLIKEKKTLPANINPSFKKCRSSQKFEQEVEGEAGNKFKIIIRISNINPSDFSIILCTKVGEKWFRLRRYNGDSHEHTNTIENEKIKGCHIHYATERYQKMGFREEDYAQPTTKYEDWKRALNVMLNETNFQLVVPKGQLRLKTGEFNKDG